MDESKRVFRGARAGLVVLALGLVCVPGQGLRADERSDLIGRIEDKLEDAADALERLPDDSGDGAIDRARALVGEARRHADELARVAGDDSTARRIAEDFDDRQDDFHEALGHLRQMKASQRLAEPVTASCIERDKELGRLALELESRNDPDGLAELPREAGKVQEQVRRQLEELVRLDDRMDDAADDAGDFAADGPWRELSSTVGQVARGIFDRWRRGHEDAKRACEAVSRGVEHPVVRETLARLGSSAAGRKQVIEQLNRNASELWSTLARVSEDSGMGPIERARSLIAELERAIETLARTPTTDKETRIIVEKWPAGLAQLKPAVEALARLKQHQHDLDELPGKCELRKRELREAVEKNGDDTDGIQELPALAEKLAEPVRVGLEKARERGREEDLDRDQADDVTVTEGALASGPSTLQREAEETHRTFAEALQKTEAACAEVVQGSNGPIVNQALTRLRAQASTTGDQLDRDVAAWTEAARGAYILDCKAMEELWQAYCGADWEPGDESPKDLAEQTAAAIQSRMQGSMKPLLDQLTALRPRVQALAKKRETRARGETLAALLDKEEPRLNRLVNQGTWRGNNHPLIQYARRYGADRHRAEWSALGCQVPTSDTGVAVFPGGDHQKPDCIIARAGQCEIWEFKPDSEAGRRDGPPQINVYKQTVPNYYTEKYRRKEAPDDSHGGMAFLDELRKHCFDEDRDKIVFKTADVKYYTMCEKQYVCEQ